MHDARQRLAELDEACAREVSPGSPSEALLMEALADLTTLVRERAIALAARHLRPEMLGSLIREEANATSRNSALSALERQGSYAVPYLTSLTRDADPEVAMFAVQVLCQIRDPSTLGALLPLMEHPDLNIAQAAVEALGNIRARQAVPGLIQLLRGDLWLQVAAVAALGEIGDPRGVPALLELLRDEMLGASVAEALAQLAAPQAVPELVRLLVEADRLPVRDSCLRALARTVEQHALGGDRFESMQRAATPDGELTRYLEILLLGDDRSLAHDAATVVVAAELPALLAAVLARTHAPDELPWTTSLFRRASPALCAVLPDLLVHEDPRVRRGALVVGALGPDAHEAITARLTDDSETVRAAACVALGVLGNGSATPALLERFAKGDAEEHHAACEALAQMPATALAPLAHELQDPASPRILGALGIVESAKLVALRDSVDALLARGAPPVRRAALRALAAIDPRCAMSHLAFLSDPEESVRIELVEVIVRQECRTAIPTLIERLCVADILRYHVIRALGRLGASGAEPRLRSLFDTAQPHERIEIVNALIRMAAPDIVAFLRARLTDEEVAVRRVAADGIARLGSHEELPLLLQLAADADWNLRNYAAWGLGRLAAPSTRKALMELARDVEPIVSRTARTALGKLPPQQS